MEIKNIDIANVVIESLKDADYHTITATTLMVADYFHLSKSERNKIFNSRKISGAGNSFSSKKIYTQTQLMVTELRQVKFIKNFPKQDGIFTLTSEGLILLTKSKEERKEKISSEFKKYKNKRKSSKK